MTDEMRQRWNERFATEDYAYGTEPNAYFKAFIDSHTPGKILLPAEGEGRNAVYAAEQGWEVHAFDFSTEGQRKALRLAASRGVTITYQIADIGSVSLQSETFDAIALIYAHLHRDDRQRVHRRLLEALKPGGYLVLESFTPEQLKYGTGGPKNIDMLYDINDLREDFAGLQIIDAEERIIELSAGRSHNGKGSVVRMLVQK